jgi:hypothetical protein
MAVIAEFIIGIALIAIGAIFLDLIRDQAKTSTPGLADWLRRQAVKQLPEPMKERLGGEWEADLHDTDGALAKLLAAFGFVISAFKVQMTPELRQKTDDEAGKTKATGGTSYSTSYTIENYVRFLRTFDEYQLRDLVLRDAKSIEKLIWITYEYDWNDNRETLRRLQRLLKTYRDEIVHDCPICRGKWGSTHD